MIQVTRALVRQVRAVFLRLAPRYVPVVFSADPQGLRLRLRGPQIAAEYFQTGAFVPQEFALSLDALAQMEGRDDSLIQFEAKGGFIQARWADGGIPMLKEFPTQEVSKEPFPTPAASRCDNPPDLLHALDEAGHSAASQETHRFTTEKIQLRSSGAIVATDGRQLLWQEGFAFPWQGDVLVPVLKGLSAKELPHDQLVSIGKDDHHVTLQVGNWTFLLEADTAGRYPRAEQVIPSSTVAVAHAEIDSRDAAFLAKALTHLPGDAEGAKPVTLDLNGTFAIRAKAEQQTHPNELVLSRSKTSGKPVAFCLPREHLARALRLGLPQMHIQDAGSPVLWQDHRRKFIVMPLSKDGVIPPDPEALRVSSCAELSSAQESATERNQPIMTSSPEAQPQHESPAAELASGANGHSTSGATLQSLVDEAQSLRTVLRSAYDRAGRLITAIKQNDKRTRMLRSALASLRQLQQISA